MGSLRIPQLSAPPGRVGRGALHFALNAQGRVGRGWGVSAADMTTDPLPGKEPEPSAAAVPGLATRVNITRQPQCRPSRSKSGPAASNPRARRGPRASAHCRRGSAATDRPSASTSTSCAAASCVATEIRYDTKARAAPTRVERLQDHAAWDTLTVTSSRQHL